MIKELHRLGWSTSDIARESGHDRKTVRKVGVFTELADAQGGPTQEPNT